MDGVRDVVKPLMHAIKTMDACTGGSEGAPARAARAGEPSDRVLGSQYRIGLKMCAFQTIANFALAPPSQKQAMLDLGLLDMLLDQLARAAEAGGRPASASRRAHGNLIRHYVLLILKNITYTSPFPVRRAVLKALAGPPPPARLALAAVLEQPDARPRGAAPPRARSGWRATWRRSRARRS